MDVDYQNTGDLSTEINLFCFSGVFHFDVSQILKVNTARSLKPFPEKMKRDEKTDLKRVGTTPFGKCRSRSNHILAKAYIKLWLLLQNEKRE